jgi:acetate---CoA ligase (ADP-forming)
MLTRELIQPDSIAVIGGSNDLHKPGGNIIRNLLQGHYNGEIFIVNPKEETIQGLKCYRSLEDLPSTDLAILAIAARFCPDAVNYLANNKNTRGFIILSAGFGEENDAGASMEQEIREIVDSTGGSLIGPNCIGVINTNYQGVFTTPVPIFDPQGCDFISGSGATAVFIMEAGISNGLGFSSVYSVGNSAQIGVEEVLQHMDETFDPSVSSRVKLLYMESISKPDLLLKHASSLIRKGCRIAAIKSGTSEAGSRAASSHTGALAGSDIAASALFRKAGILRCSSREELVAVASVLMHPEIKGNRVAVVTHAGGPAVMITDALSRGGIEVPKIKGRKAEELLAFLHPGSSVTNPIDILATGNAKQLGKVLDYCNRDFEEIDAVVVIFGSPGLFDVDDVYRVLDKKMKSSQKPIFPVLPSVLNAGREIKDFLGYGRINFPDEVRLGRALSKVYFNRIFEESLPSMDIDFSLIRELVAKNEDGYLLPDDTGKILDAAGIPRVREDVADTKTEAVLAAERLGLPVAMKVVGPVHKSDVGGVVLNISNAEVVADEFERMMMIEGASAVLIQPMQDGTELFAGVNREGNFGHLILCGLGGIFVEALKDISAGLAPLSEDEAGYMICSLKGYPVISGVRGESGINEDAFRDILLRLSGLVTAVPQIAEMDLNPLMGNAEGVWAVDARIRFQKDK